MSREIYIICYRYLNSDLKSRSIGGIQTYIYNLCRLITEEEYKPIIIQQSTVDFQVCLETGEKVIGVASSRKEFSKKAIRIVKNAYLVIFATEDLIEKTECESVAIQHGISWDIPVHLEWSLLKNRLYSAMRYFCAIKKCKKISMVKRLVCVDYNFINWYRTQLAYPETQLIGIPNFTEIHDFIKPVHDNIKIIFARRFFAYRGTTIFAEALTNVLKRHEKIQVVIAGEGPDEDYLRSKLAADERVSFIKYVNTDSFSIHRDVDIAVIPTIGSEGTSLSLLEAMACKCAVICSNVGGMTNIVIDQYNGLIVNPDSTSLEIAIEELIGNKELRVKLANNAFDTVKEGFDVNVWKQKWKRVLF